MASISSAGLGSGLDVNGLVSQLVAAEKAPTSGRLTTRETRVQSLLSAYGTLKSSVAEFQDALKKLKQPATFSSHSASSSDTDLLKVSAGTSAVPATYSVKVEAVAQTQKLASAGYASAATAVGTGRLDIAAGGKNFSVNIDSGNQSLAGIRDAINSASGNPGVKATLVTASTGTHLVITAAGSGAAQAVKMTAVTGVGDSGDLAQLNYDPLALSNPMTVKSEARDARINLDGFTLTSATNTFSDAIAGLTLTVVDADPDTTLEVKVDQDRAASRQAIDQFVSGYNKLRSTLNSLTAFNASTKSAGQLQGDSTTMQLASTLRNEINTALAGADVDLDTLAELGISSAAKGGTLSVDSTRMDKVLSTRFDDVAKMFSGDSGFAARLNSSLDRFTASQGSIQSRTDSLQAQAKSLSAQRDALELRMSKLESRYLAQFTALDKLMSGLSSTSSFLTQQLSNLS